MKNYKRIGISIGVLMMIAMTTACGSENISKNSSEEHRVLKTAEAVAAAEETKVETTEPTTSSEESKADTTKAKKTDEESKTETTKANKSDEDSKTETKKDIKADEKPTEETKAEPTKPAAAPVETKTETTNTFTAPIETKAETTETKVDNEVNNTKKTSDYAQLLDWYYDQISTEWSNYDMQKSGYGVARPEDSDDTVSYMWCCNRKPDLTNSGYQIKDINKDGVDELVVGKKGNGDSDTIYDLYTINDGEVVRVASSGERDKFYVKDDTIHESGSSSAALYGNTSYRLVDGKAVPFEQIKYDRFEDADDPYFYLNEPVASENGGYDFQNMQHITEEEMKQMDEHETNDIDLQPFSDYKTTDND